LIGLLLKLGAQRPGHTSSVRCNALQQRPRSHRPRAALSAHPFWPALLGYAHIAPAAVVAARALSYRAGMSTHLWPNPAVNSDAPVHIFCFAHAAGGAPVT
jgi:hypothetical protein